MTLWKRILSAVNPLSGCPAPEAASGVTGRPAPRPYSVTERYLIALSIGRATHGSFG